MINSFQHSTDHLPPVYHTSISALPLLIILLSSISIILTPTEQSIPYSFPFLAFHSLNHLSLIRASVILRSGFPSLFHPLLTFPFHHLTSYLLVISPSLKFSISYSALPNFPLIICFFYLSFILFLIFPSLLYRLSPLRSLPPLFTRCFNALSFSCLYHPLPPVHGQARNKKNI